MSLREDYLKAIGRIVVNFQNVETLLSLCTWSLIGAEQQVGMIITAQLSFSRLCDLFASLVRHRFGSSELTDDSDALMKRAAQLEEKRNAILHSLWVVDENQSDKVSRFKITANRLKGLKQQLPAVDVEELNNIADALDGLPGDLFAFMFRASATGKVTLPNATSLNSPSTNRS